MNQQGVARPGYRPYLVEVAEMIRLSPSFVRIRFAGTDLGHFGTAGFDQRLKVLIPHEDGRLGDVGAEDAATIDAGTWHDRWRSLPDADRNPIRTYTIRRVDPVRRLVDVDFVLHEPAGPAGRWAASADIGDPVVLVGPDERSPDRASGIDWKPGTATSVLLVADETAVPAAMSILEAVSPDQRVWAFLEVPDADDVIERGWPPGVEVSWHARGDSAHGGSLVQRVRSWMDRHRDILTAARAPMPQMVPELDVDVELLWESPAPTVDGGLYAWLAGEAAVIKVLRRALVTEAGVDRRRVAFMGYWRAGQSERQR